MKYYRILRVFSLLALLFFALPTPEGHCFFTASEISLVKNEPFPLDKSITFEKLFYSYQYCKGGQWEVKKTERGQKIVEFRAQYLPLGVVAGQMATKFRNVEAYFPKIADYLISSNFKVFLVAQFTIAADGKSFSPAFLGLEYNGESYGPSIEVDYRRILKNETMNSLPREAGLEFEYRFHRFILENHKNLIADYVGKNPATDVLYFLEVNRLSYDDARRAIVIEGSINITDVVANTLAENDSFDSSTGSQNLNYLSGIKSVNLKNHVVKSIPVRLSTGVDVSRVDWISFMAENADAQFTIAVRKLTPIEINIRLQYRGGGSETAPISSIDKPSPAKKITFSTGAYAYQQEGLVGELLLNPLHESPGKYYLSVSTSSDTGNACEFEGECMTKDGLLICSNDDIKEDKDNHIIINIMDNDILDITKSYAPLCGPGAYLNGNYTPKCLDKIRETKTASGTYLGWFEPEDGLNTIGIKLNNGSELYIVASEEEANRLFGNKKGQTVSVTYNVEQMWIWDECSRVDVLKKD